MYVFNLPQVVSLVTVTNLTVRKLQKTYLLIHKLTFKPSYVDYAFWSLKALIKVNVIIFHRIHDLCRNVFSVFNFLVCLSAYKSLTHWHYDTSGLHSTGLWCHIICNWCPTFWCNVVVFLLRVEYSHAVSSLEIWTVDDETNTLSQDIGHQSLSDAALYPITMETSNSPMWKPNLAL